MLLSHIVHDVRSVTGRNMRKILLLLKKDDIYKVRKSDANKIEYFPLTKEDEWKSDLINELIEIRENGLGLEGFKSEEVNEMIENICTS